MAEFSFTVLYDTNEPVEFSGEPLAVFQFLSRVKDLITVNDQIEDPAVDHFFVVLKELDGNTWLCSLDDKQLVAHWHNPPSKVGNFSKFTLPLIRKAYPKLVADKLVDVQPMTQPASLIFYIRHRYSKRSL